MAAAPATAPGVLGSAAAAAVAAAAAAVAANDEDVSPELYLGVVKSYNDRRGFGFVACVETSDRYGRDVYMPKAEATLAAAEFSGLDIDPEAAAAAAEKAAEAEKAAAALAAAAAQKTTSGGADDKVDKPPPAPRLAEEDLVLFRVRLSVEGYPQGACVKKLQKFNGVVVIPPRDEMSPEGAKPGLLRSDDMNASLGTAEIEVLSGACGQVRLSVGDEVTFCVPQEPVEPVSYAPRPQAMMVALTRTHRASGSVVGCFTLDLPRTGMPEGAPPKPNLTLDCHAFGDKLVLAGLPADLGEAELMRFFSKQGATGAIVAHAKSRSFASVSFLGTAEVARFLGRIAHAFADEKETRIAKLLPLNTAADTARLPALPAPSLTVGEEAGSLLVVWSPLVLAVGYSVELRPAGADGPWAIVEAGGGSSRLGVTAGATSRFSSDCSSCRVVGLQNTAYEARVSYFTDCGTRSEASEASDWCLTSGAPQAALGPMPPARQYLEAAVPMPHIGSTMPAGYSHEELAHAYAQPPIGPPPPMWPPPQPMLGQGYGGDFVPALPAYIPSPGWRSMSGMVVPPPARPALRPADDFGFAVSVQWPAVAQAAAYVVELREAGSAAFERFVRSAPEAKLGTLVELRVGGLRPGPPPGHVYVAQVRTVAVDGSESAPSPPGWSPPLPSQQAPLPSPSGSMLSAEAATFQPSAAAANAAAEYRAEMTRVHPGSVPAAAPVGLPLSGLSNWAPPPWLGQQPTRYPAMQPLGAFGAPQATAPLGGGFTAMGGPGELQPTAFQAPSQMLQGIGDYRPAAPTKAAAVPWGAPGGPPPPPTGPPPPVTASVARVGDRPPPEITGNEECLILD